MELLVELLKDIVGDFSIRLFFFLVRLSNPSCCNKQAQHFSSLPYGGWYFTLGIVKCELGMIDCSAPQRHTWTQATSSYFSSCHEISRVLPDFWYLSSNKQRNRKMRLSSGCICSLHILLARIGSPDPTGLQGGWEMWPSLWHTWFCSCYK